MTPWRFYGRRQERDELAAILDRRRWFFARITGRRRIGKTTLIQEALGRGPARKCFYVQIPDSAPAGVLSAVTDAMETFEVDPARFAPPTNLRALAQSVGDMARAGYIVVLDEFQYFARRHLFEFTSHLQAVVDELARRSSEVPGGLFVLGSLHTELVALLEDRSAPLYNRTTDNIELGHLDVASILDILDAHVGDFDPHRLLFLWSLFEGVPKFYRDCFEQGALAAERDELLRAMFFRSSSPLRGEADNWFLNELRGRYDVILKYISRNPGCTNGDIRSYVESVNPQGSEQVGGYIQALAGKFRMVERKLPIFAKPSARNGRYYIRDNFLRSWLGALHSPVSAINFRPEPVLVQQAREHLAQVEGFSFEKLVAQLYAERSRAGVGDFEMSERIVGFWDRKGTELDLVALNEDERRVRIASCKRNPDKLLADLPSYDGHIERFVGLHPRRFADWTVERVALAPSLSAAQREKIEARGYLAQDLGDLTRDLR
ncbi:ATP-binding protein [Pseudenhygromyxa sp. WMMC2535]|uniref:ATP-binding protein n=1 Tax=Pseudenhygromyxa sp. WMMC2535 TaxID=2712867 RepID=UPI001556D9C1|nr:ATP-binding protein [Pseudenhygromyxa sp. WMMC2535]NVB36887.1 ATP-binding protein [Pseudenhygromyxa sp. WMMC2535]